MMPLEITPATIVVGLVVIALALVAVRRIVTKGSCDCHDSGAGKASGGCAGCAGCGAADRMLADMENAAKKAATTP